MHRRVADYGFTLTVDGPTGATAGRSEAREKGPDSLATPRADVPPGPIDTSTTEYCGHKAGSTAVQGGIAVMPSWAKVNRSGASTSPLAVATVLATTGPTTIGVPVATSTDSTNTLAW